MEGSGVGGHAALAARILQGDSQAEAELYARFEMGVKQILMRATQDFAAAEDLCQETLLIALKRLRREPLRDPERLPAFIAQIARNLAVAIHRKNRRQRTDPATEAVERIMDSCSDVQAEIELSSSAAAVHAVLTELKSPRDRELLVRYYLREEEKAAICRDLGVSERNFDVLLFRARNRLLECLQRRGVGKRELLCFFLV